MKIEKGNIEDFGQKRFVARYSKAFDALRSLEINGCLKITLDESDLNFYSIVMQYFRATRFPEFKFSCRRKDRTGKVFLFMKIKRNPK